jgi:O-antigen/teichoic acid export membrane protein
MAIVAGSLAATWSVALLVRLVLPRHLGPTTFGQYAFAEALAINGFGFLGFGIDTYIQKEIPRRPEHASDFFGGVQAVRLAGALVVLGVVALVAKGSGRSTIVVGTALAFGVAQLCFLMANTSATLLYAAQSVGRLSALNIATKLAWAGGITLAMLLHASLWCYALAAVLSEALRLAVLYRLGQQVVRVRVRIDLRQTWRALKQSSPFYLNQVAIALYAKIGVAIMGVLVTDRELGFYGAATNVSSMAMLMSPFMGWVLTPQLSRLVGDREAFASMLRRSLEWTVVLAIPVALMLALGADVIVYTVFGARFAPAIAAMRALMPIFVFVYVAILGATALILVDRSWTVTTVTLLSLGANAGLNFVVVRPVWHLLGDGGAGVGSAVVSVFTEAVVAGAYLWMLRREMLDARNIAAMSKSLGTCALVVVCHVLMAPLGPMRLVLDVLLYVLVSMAIHTVRSSEVAALVRSIRLERSHANN